MAGLDIWSGLILSQVGEWVWLGEDGDWFGLGLSLAEMMSWLGLENQFCWTFGWVGNFVGLEILIG